MIIYDFTNYRLINHRETTVINIDTWLSYMSEEI